MMIIKRNFPTKFSSLGVSMMMMFPMMVTDGSPVLLVEPVQNPMNKVLYKHYGYSSYLFYSIHIYSPYSECKNLLYHVTLLITILIRITYHITMSQKDDKKKRVTALFLSSFCYVIREYFLVFSRAI